MNRMLSVSYDLLTPGRDYTSLHHAIKQLGSSWVKPLESYWLVITSKSTAQARDFLKPYLDNNDRLLVMQAGPDWASLNIAKGSSDWIKTIYP